MSRFNFGVIAEDETDFKVARTLIQRLCGKSLKVIPRVTNGCGRLDGKLGVWMSQLADAGCGAIVVLRDLDRNAFNALNDEENLRRKLESVAVPRGVRRMVCIPVEELEAWFWSDPKIVQRVGCGQGKASASPHLISKPKEALMNLSGRARGKPRYSSNDNESLAQILDLELCAKRCRSFLQFRDFVLREVQLWL